ncbi:uncharacterized protein LOC134222209 [Armigeres subalbatus]|uniref:uncharacterized protein LOC134222209 n=1 Tax=Armigeres subalbatus TaxID=124917 RepID=UPI002ED1280E
MPNGVVPVQSVLATISSCNSSYVSCELKLYVLSKITRELPGSGLILRNTPRGWIVAGSIPEVSVVSYNTVAFAHVTTEELREELGRLWELESYRTKSCLSIEESACEAIFEETTIRDSDGHFRVRLPKRKNMIEKLGKSKLIAKKRVLSIKKRLDANTEIKVLYTAFMYEHLQMVHMQETVKDSEDEGSGPEHYIPHHAVVKRDSTTRDKTKSSFRCILR